MKLSAKFIFISIAAIICFASVLTACRAENNKEDGKETGKAAGKEADKEVSNSLRVFEDGNYKIYAIQAKPTRPPASLFTSVDPKEPFVQTAKDYEGSINVFIVEFKSDGKRVMIDTGFGAGKDRLQEILRQAAIAPESISDIYVTHIHPDHVGGLKDFPKAQIHIAKDEYEAWKTDPNRQNLAQALPEQDKLHLFDYQDSFPHGLQAIKCAGHTPGHTVYRLDKRYFVGDLLHAVDLQYEHPSFCAAYDMNPREAAASRQAAKENFHGEWLGAHISFPGVLNNP